MQSTRIFVAAFLMVLVAAYLVEQRAEAQAGKPNMVWINAEDMSPHLGCYGDPLAITPNIDRLAEKGVVYQNAFATAPICAPSRSCLATGLYATSLGTQHLRCEVEIPERVVPLPVRLRELGYFCTNTGKSDYNFDPDGIWDAWSNEPAPWRARKAGQPFYAFITIGDTHEGPTNNVERYQRATQDLPDELRHDSARVTPPPFYPDSPEIRSIFANMYDLATIFDRKVGDILQWIEDDDELDDTFVFIYGDHGNGLPRYKRWLNDSGLRVPLVVHIPANYASLSPDAPGTETERMVSFVDFAATAMVLAGGEVPAILQGTAFLGAQPAPPREYIYGARSRADDMFEVSRSVYDGRYLYVRHFLPHLPYMQPGVIYGDQKRSFRELRRLYNAGEIHGPALAMWEPEKPAEELYDLKTDPHEINNLADDTTHAETKRALAAVLKKWMAAHRDSGLLPEAEYQIRAAEADLTPFDIVQDPNRFDLDATLNAAWRVGDDSVPVTTLIAGLEHGERGVRYWSATAFQARSEAVPEARDALMHGLEDASPSVRIAAAKALIDAGDVQPALGTLETALRDHRPWVQLEAARNLALCGSAAKPAAQSMHEARNALRSPPGGTREYKDFNYASFTGWALEAALTACGESFETRDWQ